MKIRFLFHSKTFFRCIARYESKKGADMGEKGFFIYDYVI